MKFKQQNDTYITPPGSLTERLSHPREKYESGIELSVFNDHRYAFFFWNNWTRKLANQNSFSAPPCLVTLDWHQDLVIPDKTEKEWMNKLNLESNREVALFAWENLSNLNDTHILSAAYLNMIGNIYVHCRQGSFDSDWEDDEIVDKFGNVHIVKKFKKYEDLQNHLISSNETEVYFDIDLDFFTLNNPFNGKGKRYTYVNQQETRRMLAIDTPLIAWVFERLKGITIAKEPEHTGGLLKSNKLLDLINNCWFKPGLFVSHPGDWDQYTDWKHLKK
jgi:hypothetical protein